ncbi:helix-turn-helix domain-containing protein [Pseudofrankia inefficax]|uniref:Helix-turn-helix domain protein n=1 Tax=Pseudofrankia inefficax (strain DSM 45817 / CECT 9037 / DDB 130130 / EuI1c) TaxID=298654 RepID=E3J632_PSEI1|nr:helix-turn-helix transcriptional regulator [Pseudofrankia inefficax]ADP78323.1 helix-turn-helix domain protein [Pseudofrankia inefficax]
MDAGDRPISGNLRDLRRTAGLSQEELAGRTGLSVSTVRKVEQGGSARVETLHVLARALGVETSALFGSQAPKPADAEEENKLNLVAFRHALTPAVGFGGSTRRVDGLVAAGIERESLGRDLRAAVTRYHADDFEGVARGLPRMVAATNELVRQSAGDEVASLAAQRLRSDVLQLAGWFLTQVRQYDLAYVALRDAVADGESSDDRLSVAASVISQCWLFIRQGRFSDAELLAGDAATQIEPRMSEASKEELAAWGWLLLRGSAAAIRNNRSDESREFLRLAEVAAVRHDGQPRRMAAGYHQYWSTFDVSTVRMKIAEALMIDGDASGVLRVAEGVQAPRRAGRSDNYSRHLLDVAGAHAALRNYQDAIDILSSLRSTTPDWLRHQRRAGDLVGGLVTSRKRRVGQDLRELAGFFGSTGS